MSVIRSFIFFNIKYEYTITLILTLSSLKKKHKHYSNILFVVGSTVYRFVYLFHTWFKSHQNNTRRPQCCICNVLVSKCPIYYRR